MIRSDWDDLAANGQKGDWYFLQDDTYITIRYGDGPLEVVTLPMSSTGDTTHWQWDGNKEVPTLSPSILIRGGSENAELWHGYLRAGELINA